MTKVSWLALVFAGVSSSALAQTTTDKSTPVTDAAASRPATVQQGIADIVVTARRREESLQNAAVAVDAVTGSDLARQGIVNPGDITKSVPSITITNGGGSSTSIYLRGVGNKTSSSWTDPAVAVSYDGVFLGRAAAAFGSAFYDLSRVEVLKGPQGILYGRNATGGAINIIPNKPKLGDYSGGFDISVGNYDAVQAQAYVNVPLGDSAALRLAGTRQTHDPYNLDGTSDEDVSSLRAQLLYRPSDALSVRIAADATHIGGAGQGFAYLGNYSPNAAGGYDYTPAPLAIDEGMGTDAANAYRETLLSAPGFGFLDALNAKPYQDFKVWGVNGEVNYRTGLGTFTFIPAYREQKGSSALNGPAFNTAMTYETDKQYSFEGRLAGSRSFLDYLIGGYYFHESINSRNEYNQEFVLPIQRYLQKTESWAAFGQLTAHVSDRFRLIGGARYTHDFKDMNGMINNFITFCGGLPPANIVPPASFAAGCAAPGALPHFPNLLTTGDTISWLVANGWIDPSSTDQAGYQAFPLTNGVATILKTYDPVIDHGTYSRVTWKASAEYDLAPHSLLYATVETGYRAGGFQLAEGRPKYNPEFLTAYTIGSKNRFFDNRVQLNLEAYLWKYRDQQITYFTVDTSGTLISSTENAGRATIKGVDADLIVKPLARTTLSAEVQYLDTNYDDLHLYTASPRDNINCPYTLTGQIAGGAPVKDFNCSGTSLLFSPKWTVNLGAEQMVPLRDGLDLIASVNTAWRDKQLGGFERLDFERIPGYWNTDLNVTLQAGKFGVGAFVRNLEGKRRNLAPQLAPTGQAVTLFSAPRTYGVRLTGNF